MKRRNLVIALLALAAVTAAVGTVVASLVPTPVATYIKLNTGDVVPTKAIGTIGDNALPNNLTVSIFDTRVNAYVTRDAFYLNSSNVWVRAKTSSTSIVVIPRASAGGYDLP